MGRNLYILAATIGILALISFALSFTNVAQVPGSPGDVRLWRTTSIALVFVGLVIALGGVLSQLFEQAERRATEQRAAAATGISNPQLVLDTHDILKMWEGFGPASSPGPRVHHSVTLGPDLKSLLRRLCAKSGGRGRIPR